MRDLLWPLRPPLFQNVDLNLSLDYRVLLFMLAVSLAKRLLCGVAPAHALLFIAAFAPPPAREEMRRARHGWRAAK